MSDRKIIYLDDAINVLEERLKANGYSNVALASELNRSIGYLMRLPPAQPEQDILSWLLAYHTKSFDLHGRYMPHEVIGWLVHDFANAYMAERREE